MRHYMNATAVARALGYSRQHIHRLQSQGEMPFKPAVALETDQGTVYGWSQKQVDRLREHFFGSESE